MIGTYFGLILKPTEGFGERFPDVTLSILRYKVTDSLTIMQLLFYARVCEYREGTKYNEYL